MINKTRKCCLLLLCGVGLTTANAQSGIHSSGNNLSGAGGSVSYSVGQVFYTTNTGSTGTVAQGVQQPFEIQVVLGVEQFEIKLNAKVYPNPTTDVLNLSVGNTETVGLSYQLFDFSGRLLADSKIENEETAIQMSRYPRANYLLSVIQDNKTIKTFKIIKN
jgi:hypothetical protein